MGRKWNNIIKKLESESSQDRLAGITDELVERSVYAPLRYEHMIPVVLKVIGTIFACASSGHSLTGIMYVRYAADIYNRIEGSYNSDENNRIWNEIRNSMPVTLQRYWLGPDLNGKLFFDNFTGKDAEAFLDYLESKAFDDMMKKIRRSHMVIPKAML